MANDGLLIVAIMGGLAGAIGIRVWLNKRFRAKLIRDFVNDPERKRRQGDLP